jgi:hypothetical protein
VLRQLGAGAKVPEGTAFQRAGSFPSHAGEGLVTLRQVKALPRGPRQIRKMANLIFRCVKTGMNVQVWLPDEAPTDHADSYEAVTCPACTRIHLVNTTTGKMLGDRDK